jgi:hypothetical protein
MWEVEVELHEFVTAGIDSGSGQLYIPAVLPPAPKATDQAFIRMFSIGGITWQTCY